MCLYRLLQKILAKENKRVKGGFPGDPVAKNSPATVGHTLEPVSHNYWAHGLQLLKPMHLEPMLHSKRSLCKRSPHTTTRESPQQWRSSAAENKIKIKSFFKENVKACNHFWFTSPKHWTLLDCNQIPLRKFHLLSIRFSNASDLSRLRS